MTQAPTQRSPRNECIVMEAPHPIIAPASAPQRRLRFARRKIRLELFELEPESGEDQPLPIDLGLDQVES